MDISWTRDQYDETYLFSYILPFHEDKRRFWIRNENNFNQN